MNLANGLTALRVVLVPFILAALAGGGQQMAWVAAVLFGIAALTDLLDGYVARQQRLQSSMGVFLDLTADKLLVLSVLIALVQLQEVPAWAVILVMARDVIISGLRSYAAAAGMVIAAGPWGKLKTVVTLIALVGVLARLEPYALWLFSLGVALTVYSAIDYIWFAIPVLRKRSSRPSDPNEA